MLYLGCNINFTYVVGLKVAVRKLAIDKFTKNETP